MADSPILDYYRGSDLGCKLRRIGENYIEDTYAIGMSKGFPLKESISALIAKYSSNGYLDILIEKWYGGLPCYRDEEHIEIVQPRPLGVAAVAGVYLMLGLGMILGVLILVFEHTFFKYYLPILRHKPKGSVWRSRNIMFFSQVRNDTTYGGRKSRLRKKMTDLLHPPETVSLHQLCRAGIASSCRPGTSAHPEKRTYHESVPEERKEGKFVIEVNQWTILTHALFQKEDEQRRRRKSKAQFFEMIQEIRR